MVTQESHNLSLPVRFWGRARRYYIFASSYDFFAFRHAIMSLLYITAIAVGLNGLRTFAHHPSSCEY
jgi:hypothetical protein